VTNRKGYYDISSPRLDARTRFVADRERFRLMDEERPTYDLVVGEGAKGLHLVIPESPVTLHKKVYDMAVVFRREFRYDFVQYSVEEATNYAGNEAWIWVDQDDYRYGHVVTGAAAFVQHRFPTYGTTWVLNWIWQHPYKRRAGRLREAWPKWQHRYGNFYVEGPWSTAMQNFLMTSGHVLHDGRTAREWVEERDEPGDSTT
jgi:hypothetical protein